MIGTFFPPRYSERCNLASDDRTPKCAYMISVYLEPLKASSSYICCNAIAIRNSFTVAALAVDRSAYAPFAIVPVNPDCVAVVVTPTPFRFCVFTTFPPLLPLFMLYAPVATCTDGSVLLVI